MDGAKVEGKLIFDIKRKSRDDSNFDISSENQRIIITTIGTDIF